MKTSGDCMKQDKSYKKINVTNDVLMQTSS